MSAPEPAATPPAAPDPVIVTRALARWYGPVVGITDVTLTVPPGIVGFLGPNGAGKSTFMRVLTGQIHPSSGEVTILGRRPWKDADVFREVGFCSEDDALYDDLTPLETVTFLARCSGYSREEARTRAERALERTGIAHARDRRCGGFSKGMRQRTRLAAAIVHDPRILLLDEPMTGLDPVGRRHVMDLVRTLAREGRTVVFASHILHEVESVAQHVVVMNRGMVLAEGTLAEIQEDLQDYAFTLEVHCDRPRALARELALKDHVVGLTFTADGALRISSESSKSLLSELPALALDNDIQVQELSCPGEDLETVFQRLVR